MITLQCPAKINLSLRIVGRRADGYHLLDSLVAPINWYDEIQLEPAPTLLFRCTASGWAARCSIPHDERNLVVRAAKALAEHAAFSRVPAAIHLHKHLPSGAGLGGGSSNAAACLVGLNRLWELNLSQDSLRAIAHRLGADIPFFVDTKPARMQGVGEQLTAHSVTPHPLVLVLPEIHCDTATVYNTYDAMAQQRNATAQLTSPEGGVPFPPLQQAGNDLTDAILQAYPQLAELYKALQCFQEVGVTEYRWQFSGSGSCLFRRCVSPHQAQQLKQRIADTFAVQTKVVYTTSV